MPRPNLTSHVTTAPLAIAAVAERIGVSASTIRTWERRYGLGPAKREPGKRRRYEPEEVAMLENMVRLVREGVSPSDAARTILESNDVLAGSECEFTVDQLVEQARQNDLAGLQRNLDVLISRTGLLRTWTEFISPALRYSYYPPGGDLPGYAPRALIKQATLSVLREIAVQADEHAATAPDACSVLIVCDSNRELHAHVIGVSLQWEGVPARILPVTAPSADPTVIRRDIIDVILNFREDLNAHTLVLVGSLAADADVVEGVDDGESNLVLVCGHRCSKAAPDATRIRTVPACVEETVELARNCTVPGCKSD
ncbi:MAG: MerR family transcriptional regulator [Actinomycetaceae bacterium]|nr:MerR family transcriptional regulator [Actinomycetaceae bacterium]